MPYTAPNPVNFDFTVSGYSAPVGNDVAFNAADNNAGLGQIQLFGLEPSFLDSNSVNLLQMTLTGLALHPSDGASGGAQLGVIALSGLLPSAMIGNMPTAQPPGAMLIDGLALSAVTRYSGALPDQVIATMYRCYLVGVGDPIELPIKSFQCRYSDGYTYLSCVVPGAEQYESQITSNIASDLRVFCIYRLADGSEQSLLVVSAALESFTIDDGGRSGATATIYAAATSIDYAPQTIPGVDSSYRSISDGKKRYRARIDPRLRVGDTYEINGESFIVGGIVHVIDTANSVMYISEA